MIKIVRTGGPEPELARLAEAEERRNSTREKKVFRVYSDYRIKAVLQRIFHGKCAYCESKYVATQPMDVEHWRPKSKYWFLAAEWNNLYPTCIDCNRQREHAVPMPDGSEASLLLGKLDQFPTENDVFARDRVSLVDEKPLLLDPCTDDPESLFDFTEEGVIRPNSTDPRSEISIRIYALNRMGLVHSRREHSLLIGKHIHRIKQLGKAIEHIEDRGRTTGSQTALIAILEDLIRYEMEALRGMCADSQPYAGLSRYVINQFFNSLGEIPPSDVEAEL